MIRSEKPTNFAEVNNTYLTVHTYPEFNKVEQLIHGSYDETKGQPVITVPDSIPSIFIVQIFPHGKVYDIELCGEYGTIMIGLPQTVYRMFAMIYFDDGHYYTYVLHNDVWIKHNDDDITVVADPRRSIYKKRYGGPIREGVLGSHPQAVLYMRAP
jgi:hypothetical protein